MKLNYEKYKKYLRQDLSFYEFKIGEKVLVINFNEQYVKVGKITRIYNDRLIVDNGMSFNFENYGHNYADFYPLKLFLKEKINKLLNI